ncbi:hypothetical protein OsccyDRAFT_4036 [Leptolyngbyaceae cyanobacterium JSC-12]|nr:hypothetical protein OsccyDRAFT_4036 [Leptolyngbyaceae cyanobacterium JSC-12]
MCDRMHRALLAGWWNSTIDIDIIQILNRQELLERS